jgi:hypothetical protein
MTKPKLPPAYPAAIDPDAALAMLRMGAPLSTPIVNRQFSPKYQKIANKVMLAAIKFRNHGCNFIVKQIKGDESGQRDYKLARKAFGKLEHLYKAVQTDDAEPRWRETPDGGSEMVNVEAVANAGLIRSYLESGLAAWTEVFTKLDAGIEAQMRITKDSPLLFRFPWEPS